MEDDPNNPWREVVFSADCNEDGDCPICGIDYGDCECPRPTQDDLYEYTFNEHGVMFARNLPDADRS